ncbi:hypothetical protein ACRALDRAFT_1066774 [Sodiomyces alcalophilus JCM 7366]|uniref:uncharacterized protein n=1 Tax=Sodiomyces alcalophilus JCM 7366 TaxID=591952 RepID=UPI0039B6248E
MTGHALSDKDVNAPVTTNVATDPSDKSDVKSMEYHRQVFQNKIAQEKYERQHTTHSRRSIHNGAAEDENKKPIHLHQTTGLTRDPRDRTKQYISPSDNIMSPCTAKLNAFRSKKIGKAKPRSLFAQASSKKLDGEPLFAAKPPSPTKSNSTP